MPSYLSKREGTYDPGKRYAFTNISEEPIQLKWNSRIVATVQPHQTIEISDATPYPGSGMGQALGYTATKHLVDKIILQEGTIDAERLGMKLDKSYVSPVGTRAGIPEARKPYEQLILQELPANQELSQVLEQQKADEIVRDMTKQPGVSYSSAKPEFVNVPKAMGQSAPEAEIPKAKDLSEAGEKAKRGRPKKSASA